MTKLPAEVSSSLTGLCVLLLSGNVLSGVPRLVYNCPSLVCLDLRDNMIARFDAIDPSTGRSYMLPRLRMLLLPYMTDPDSVSSVAPQLRRVGGPRVKQSKWSDDEDQSPMSKSPFEATRLHSYSSQLLSPSKETPKELRYVFEGD